MTQLVNTSNFIKRNIPPVLFAIAVSTLSALIYHRYFSEDKNIQLPPQQKPTISSLSAKTTDFGTENLTVDNKDVKNLPIHTKSETTYDASDTKIFLNFLNLENNPKKIEDVKRGTGELFTATDGFLIVYEKSMVYQSYVRPNLETDKFDEETLKQKAVETLQNLGLSVDYVPTVSYSKFNGESMLDANSSSDANYINFLFDYKLEQLPVVSNSEMVKISYASDGSLFKIEITPFETTQTSQNYPIISINNAIDLLKNGDYLTNISGDRDDLFLLNNITFVDLNKAYLAYYFSYTDNQVQPVWVFEGTGKTDTDDFRAKYAVPAIEERYFTQP